MLSKQRHPAECLATPVAGVLFDIAMGLQVSPEVAPIGKCAIAVLTSEWLLAGMRPDVTLKQPRPGECLATCMALAGQRVRSNVHFQCAQTDIYF